MAITVSDELEMVAFGVQESASVETAIPTKLSEDEIQLETIE